MSYVYGFEEIVEMTDHLIKKEVREEPSVAVFSASLWDACLENFKQYLSETGQLTERLEKSIDRFLVRKFSE